MSDGKMNSIVNNIVLLSNRIYYYARENRIIESISNTILDIYLK